MLQRSEVKRDISTTHLAGKEELFLFADLCSGHTVVLVLSTLTHEPHFSAACSGSHKRLVPIGDESMFSISPKGPRRPVHKAPMQH